VISQWRPLRDGVACHCWFRARPATNGFRSAITPQRLNPRPAGSTLRIEPVIPGHPMRFCHSSGPEAGGRSLTYPLRHASPQLTY
jgi:hypothetical protein